MRGGRRLTVFGTSIVVTPGTQFPHYRKFPLPKRGCKSEVVRYSDFVQLHSVVMYLEQLHAPPTIVEVGAHHGAYAVLLGRKAQELGGTVIAVEPNPESSLVLRTNVELNGLQSTVFCEEVAVLDRPGRRRLVLQGEESHIAPETSALGHPVECATMSDLLSKHRIKHVDLLLIDVEGAELLVLKGYPWGSVGVQRIYCELHPYAWRHLGYVPADFERFLVDHELKCYDMYLQEYSRFEEEGYIGPTLLVRATGG